MENLMIFEGHDMEVFKFDGQVLFNPKHVAEILGIADVKSSTRNFNSKQLIKVKNSDVHNMHFRKLNNAGENFLTESGVYKLILRSHKPEAERFGDWVTDEVLPSIRKNGAYIRNQENMTADEIMARGLLAAQKIIVAKEQEIQFKDKQLLYQQKVISELQPKANYVDMILQNKSLVLITQIAKDYGMSGRAFNKLLNKLGVQYKVGDQWVLYAKYQACGYVHSRTIEFRHRDGTTDVKMQTEWTQKGRLFLYETLKKEGYLPLIEAA